MKSETLKIRLTRADELKNPIATLPLIRKAHVQALNSLGVETIGDMVNHFPFRYNDFSQVVPISLAPLNAKSTIIGEVYEVISKRPRPRLTIVEVTLTDNSGTCIVSFFNQPWLARQLKPGDRVTCYGQMEHSYGYRRMSGPLFSVMEEDDAAGADTIQPVYRLTSQITQGWMRRLVSEALQVAKDVPDPLPADLRIRLNLMSRRLALAQIHHPSRMPDCLAARRRLTFDEVFLLQLMLLGNKAARAAAHPGLSLRTDGPALTRLPAILPFQLTADQQVAVADILPDLARSEPMDRLLLGDVGSGKTVVALHALLAAADSHCQAAMMAPTEVLANQYSRQLGPWLDSLQVSWALLTSSTTPAERKQILQGLRDNSIRIVFGTHALIERDVVFERLALVVIDEQHRFGVGQREALRNKAVAPHCLSMTATPIPRSLALTIYGDLDITYIKSRPRADTRITTRVLSRNSIGIAYDAVRAALTRGEQAYIVCPLIGQAANPVSEKSDNRDKNVAAADEVSPRQPGTANPDLPGQALFEDITAALADPAGSSEATAETEELAEPTYLTEYSDSLEENLAAARRERDFLARQVFPEHRVALLTSRQSAAEKAQVMEGFRSGNINVLVSTTVIEVGVDVPNATVMIIMDADRFGLSQLHQLRGRVGRGNRDGQAFLISNSTGEVARARLSLLESGSDGFELAEADLKLRREGDVVGLRQHGKALLKLVQVIRDANLIQTARSEAVKLLQEDADLTQPRHALLAQELARFVSGWQQTGDNT